MSPAAIAEAYLDWATHLTFSPGKRIQLVKKQCGKRSDSAIICKSTPLLAAGQTTVLNHRLRTNGSQMRLGTVALQFHVSGLSAQLEMVAQRNNRLARRFQEHENMEDFASRQILDMCSPSNFPLINPEILLRTVSKGGLNLIKGFRTRSRMRIAPSPAKSQSGPTLSSSAQRCENPRQGDLSQSNDRAHPIRADRGRRSGPSRSSSFRPGS